MTRKGGFGIIDRIVGLEQPERILLIEDDPSVRMLLAHVFDSRSTVFQATDGLQGLEMLRTERPDFVITDLMLPELDGVRVLKRARRTYYGACVPFLILTANQDEEALIQCFQEGADDFMVKPVRISELRVRVASIHVRQRMARDLNPLTRLPGNLVLKAEMARRLEERRAFTVLYVDVDHFKAYNDSQGFDAGDEALRRLGETMSELTQQERFCSVFLGHVGGDDFVALVEDDLGPEFASALFESFDGLLAELYPAADRERGWFEVPNRKGELERLPLMSLSVAGVTTSRPGLHDVRQLTHLAADLKKAAKAHAGNSLVMDRRQSAYGGLLPG
ncbi:MAG TPA: response regulator [Myxococcales bacterium LLY-WYZ-16_1]|nr:response regulator [Myxococcales bacterium LLY-WYZ-16_1]